MKIKRLFSIILMSVLIICVPTGCAANSNSGSAVQNSSTSSTAQDKVVLVYNHRHEKLNKLYL
ncbi:hypothetical protein ACTQ3J_09340 [Oscillospiraceae bacterium LCP25S3_E3]